MPYYLRFCGSCGLLVSVVGSCVYPPFLYPFCCVLGVFPPFLYGSGVFLYIVSHAMYCTSSLTLYSCCTPCVGVLTVLFVAASLCFCARQCVV
jgi:hypothetical protein